MMGSLWFYFRPILQTHEEQIPKIGMDTFFDRFLDHFEEESTLNQKMFSF